MSHTFAPRSALPRAAPGAGGAIIGILSLETRFPRIPGDVGNPDTWPFPVVIARVSGASPQRVVMDRAQGLLPAFVDAGHDLVAKGAAALVTTCGFLALVQDDLARALPVPVATSALVQVAMIARLLPKARKVGVITAAARALSPAHLAAVGADPATPVAGVAEDGAFARTFLGNDAHLDIEAAAREVVAAARALCQREPNIGALVLECANMGPYAAAVRAAVGLPVFDMVGMVHWLHAGLEPRRFGPDGPI